MKVESVKAGPIFILFVILAAVLMTSCYSVGETSTGGGGSSTGEVCFRECPYVGWGAFLTPSCWETVPCGSSASSLAYGEGKASISIDPVVMLLGEASPEGSLSLGLGGGLVPLTDTKAATVVLTNRTTDVSWLAEVEWTENGYEWNSIAPLDGYTAVYGENRFLVRVGGDEFAGSSETTVEVGLR